METQVITKVARISPERGILSRSSVTFIETITSQMPESTSDVGLDLPRRRGRWASDRLDAFPGS
jgi:hypothetical protein